MHTPLEEEQQEAQGLYELALRKLREQPGKPSKAGVRPKVLEALTLLSQTFHFEDPDGWALSWTIALEGITDRQLVDGVRQALQEHRYRTILPGAFRAYCLKASETSTGQQAEAVNINGWHYWKDELGRDFAWHLKFRGRLYARDCGCPACRANIENQWPPAKESTA